MIPKLGFTATYPKNLYLLPRDHKAALRKANVAAAVLHHTRHMPRHFQSFASVKYGYAKRNAKYLQRKLRVTGQNLPLVFTGRLRHSIVTRRQITATPKGAKLHLFPSIEGLKTGRVKSAATLAKLGRQLDQRTRVNQKKVIQMHAELVTIAPDEQAAIVKEIHRVYASQVALHQFAGTVRQRFRNP